MYAIFAITRFTLLEARRNHLLGLFLVLLLIAAMLAEFMAIMSITESHVIRTSVLSAILRIFTVFVISLYMITSMVREINDKGMEMTLALPLSRTSYYLGKFCGFATIALLIAILTGLCLLFYAPVQAVLIWTVSLYCELLIVTALCLLCIYTFTQVTIAMSCVAAFYILARTIDAIQLMSKGPLINPDAPVQKFITFAVDTLSYVLPDLYRFSPSEWLVYSGPDLNQLLPIITQTLIYLLLLITAGLIDFYRKNL